MKKSKEMTDPKFLEFYELQPYHLKKMIDAFNIKSFEDLLKMCLLMGIDPNKVQDYAEKHGDDSCPSVAAVRLDEYPFGFEDENELDEDENSDMDFAPTIPKVLFIEDREQKEFHLRIKLNNAPVPVWREIKVPSNISLEFLAYIIEEAMGWWHEHLHMFRDKDTLYKNRKEIKIERGMLPWGESRNLPTEEYALSDLLNMKGKRIKFEYDFGDSWEHDVWMKGVSDYTDEHQPGLYLVKAEGACPPEDCGGVWGYANLLELKNKNRKTREEKDRLEWYGIDKYYDEHDPNEEELTSSLEDLWNEATE